jgi:hypothetical protein
LAAQRTGLESSSVQGPDEEGFLLVLDGLHDPDCPPRFLLYCLNSLVPPSRPKPSMNPVQPAAVLHCKQVLAEAEKKASDQF